MKFLLPKEGSDEDKVYAFHVTVKLLPYFVLNSYHDFHIFLLV